MSFLARLALEFVRSPLYVVKDIVRPGKRGLAENAVRVACVLFPPFFLLLWLAWFLFNQIPYHYSRHVNRSVKSFKDRAAHVAPHDWLYLGERIRLDEDGTPRSWDPFHARGWGSFLSLTGEPLELPWSKATSLMLYGSPGSGKTVAAINLCAAEMATNPNGVVLYVDLKGDDSEIPQQLLHHAKENGYRFSYLSLENEPSHACSVLEQIAETVGHRASFAAMVQQGLGVGEGLGHNYFAVQGKSGIDGALESDPEASTFARLFEVLSDTNNRTLYPTRDAWKDLAGLRGSLREFREIPALNVSRFDDSVPTDVREHAIDFRRAATERKEVIYVRAQHFHSVVPVLVRAFYQSVRKFGANHRTLLVCDELHRALKYAPDLFAELIAMSRSSGLRPIFVTQNMSQILAEGREALLGQLLDIPVTLYFGAGDGKSAQTLAGEWRIDTVFEQHLLRQDLIPQATLRWLNENHLSSHCFLVRAARCGLAPLTLAKTQFSLPYETVRELKAKGWPRDLPGMVPRSEFQIFHKRERKKEEKRIPAPERDPSITDALGRFAK